MKVWEFDANASVETCPYVNERCMAEKNTSLSHSMHRASSGELRHAQKEGAKHLVFFFVFLLSGLDMLYFGASNGKM